MLTVEQMRECANDPGYWAGFQGERTLGQWTADAIAARQTEVQEAMGFQRRVTDEFMLPCFGYDIAVNPVERMYRFAEESAEFTQALGMTADQWAQIIAYVYGRPAGDPGQEVGGVLVTLAAACTANAIDMMSQGETELARITVPAVMAKIRAKQAGKPADVRNPLPGPSTPAGDVPAALQTEAVAPVWPAGLG